MIQKQKFKNNNILLNLLFKSKNIYGELSTYTNKDIFPFLFGIRYDYTIINLKDVSFFLKRIFKLIKYTLQKNEKILIIGNSNEVKFLLTTHFIKKNSNIIFFNTEWVNGLITNQINNTTFNKIINYLFKENEIKLILIIKSSVKDTFLKQELSSLKIPIISLINTTQTLNNINYPIVTNSKNIQSIYTLMYLLRKIF
jgi:ribosomal protein S2